MARRSVLRAVSDQPRRVVLYVRVSALMGRGGDDFHSPETQVSSMRRATAGMREVAVVQDIDVTGTTFSRDGLDKIRAMVEAGQIDAIAVYDWTRFGRNVREALTFLEWLDGHGVAVIAGGEQTDRTTPEGEFMVGMLLQVAQMHSRMIGRHWSAVIDHRARNGHAHGPPPYGYRRGDSGPEPDPFHGPIVVAAFEAYAAGGSVGDIVRQVSAVRGWSINRPALKRLLTHPFYIGKVRLGGEVFDGNHDRLIGSDLWQRVQDRAAREASIPGRRVTPAYALSGMVFCAGCERPMVATTTAGRRRVACQSRTREAGTCPGSGYPLVDDLERLVLVQVREYVDGLQRDPHAAAVRAARVAKASVDAAVTERALADVRTGMAKTHRAWVAGTTPDWLYEQGMAELRVQEDTLRGQLQELRSPQVASSAREQTSLALRMLRLWPDATPGERRHLLGLVVRRVWVRRAEYNREPIDRRTWIDPW